MEQDYWQKQDNNKPLYEDVLWNKPEQKSKAGKLLIIGGSAHGFRAVVSAYQTALENGAGQVKVILPDVLKKQLPPEFNDGVFLPTNDSGGFSVEGLSELIQTSNWADVILLIGDTGMNSETAMLHQQLLTEIDKLVVATRDAVDLLLEDAEKVANNKNLTLIMTFAQTQKLFQKVYYPKILSFSMNLYNFVEDLHKFSITYPCCITTYHQENLVSTHNGEVVTQKSPEGQFKLISGELATKTATYQLWTPESQIKTAATAFLSDGDKEPIIKY